MSIYRACLVPDNNILSRYILAMQPMANWLASALPVADAVLFEFDDINVTVYTAYDDTDSASDGRLLAFYDQFIKDYRGS